MATARNALYEEISHVLKQPYSSKHQVDLLKILQSYRIQAKSSTPLEKGLTARAALANYLVHLWRNTPNGWEHEIKKIVDDFRMQRRKEDVRKSIHLNEFEFLNEKVFYVKNAAKSIKEAPSIFAEYPIAGGPRKASKVRGVCPKCHSEGIVFASSHVGEDYYKCIYCGYQSFDVIGESSAHIAMAEELRQQSYWFKKRRG